MLGPREVESMLARIELLELLRRLALCSPGSRGWSPVDLANVLRISVNEMTPLSFPDSLAPAIADAGTAGAAAGDGGAPPAAAVGAPGNDCGPANGVAGADGDGEGDSTTHMRCERVATSLATVCARVE